MSATPSSLLPLIRSRYESAHYWVSGIVRLCDLRFTEVLYDDSASGFIGLPVAQALVRAGHIVYGVTRSGSKAKMLEGEESELPMSYDYAHVLIVCDVPQVIPVIAETSNPSPWLPLIAKLDVVIEAIGGVDVEKLSPPLLEAVSSAATKYRPAHAPKLAYIYTSGCHCHGHNPELVSDTTPITQPSEISAWRPAFERVVASHPILNGIVIRPAILYGRSGSHLSLMFNAARKGETLRWYGAPGARWSLIHPDDLGEMYRLAVEKSAILGGLMFDVANDFTESVDDLLQRLVEVSGASGIEYVEPQNGESALFVDGWIVALIGCCWYSI